MGLSQADAARRLNVSRSVVQRLWDQYQFSVSRNLFQADHELQHLQKTVFYLSARRRRTSTAAALHFKHQEEECYYGAKSSSNGSKKTSCVFPQRTTAKEPLMLGKRTCFLDAATISVLFTDESRFTMENSGRLLIWRNSANPTLLKDTVIEVVESWFGQGSRSVATLNVFHGGTVTGLRYRDETLDPYVRPYAAAIGNDFILMDDNARLHRARIVEEYLEDHGLERWNGQLDLQT
ncbi:transposable element Tcb2 transposase [Trichonephila clavipes]|nr:transposable element Tcb2 transposase [Trichonephila clavipes]